MVYLPPKSAMSNSQILSFDKMPAFSKLEVAEHQLERALQLFLDESDYVCAITLAGASEEILGKLLEQSGRENSLGSFVKLCVEIGKTSHGEEWSKKEFVTMANEFRDALKHITDGQVVSVPKDAAVEILDRAMENYWALTAKETQLMRRFRAEIHGC